MKGQTILWRGVGQPGHESCRLSFRDSEWRLAGSAVFTAKTCHHNAGSARVV
jgi:hypothetical protein